ncbi:hypothetical protein WP2S18C03_07330 [Aeromonas veronii]|nr:hypothetical protein WP2S18C03_07330 [Aeromonas veronii]
MMNLDELLGQLVEKKGSDLFVTVGTPPTLKVNGHLLSLGGEALDKKAALTLVRETLVIPPFLGAFKSRGHAACARRCFGV